MRYCYDGSFEGFLTLVKYAFDRDEFPDVIERESQETLFDDVHTISSDTEVAKSVLQIIREQLGEKIAVKIFRAFLRDTPRIEAEILRYIKIAFYEPEKRESRLTPAVKYVEDASLEVGRIKHQYLGFTRFIETKEGLLYAKIAPKQDILPLITEHFAKRLQNEKFIIHDTQRGYAYLHSKVESQFHQVVDFVEPELSKEEEQYQKLWRGFFETIAIKERENPRCQMNFIPLHMREFMTEFNSST